MSNLPSSSGDAIRERALELLANNASPTETASALGVDPSRISQLMSEKEFSNLVMERRFRVALQHTNRDRRYDSLEDQLLEKLEKTLPLLFDPIKISAILTRINAAKRRGMASGEVTTGARTIVNINLPPTAVKQFVLNGNNQVAVAGSQELVTIAPKSLMRLADESIKTTIEAANVPLENAKGSQESAGNP